MKTRSVALLLLSGLLLAAQTLLPRVSPDGGIPDLLRDAAARAPMRLEAFEALALASNPALREANSIVAASSAQAHQAGLYPNPLIGYEGDQIRGGSFRGGEQGVFVQQTFVLGGKLGLRKKIYEQQVRTDEISLFEQRLRLLSDVGQSFYAALAAQETVNLRKRLLSLALDAVTTAHQLANVGQADAPDVLQAEVEAEQAKIDYSSAQRTYLQSFRSLAALAGKPEIPVSPLEGDLEHLPQLDEDQLLSRIITDSPAIKRAQQDTLRARAALESARREAIPDLQIRAGIQQNSEPLNELTGKAVGLQGFATAAIALPLFNRNQGNIAAARAGAERAEADVSRVRLLLQRRAQPLLEAYFSGQAQAERYRSEMIPRAKRAYELYLEKYRGMGAAYPQVLVSQRTLFQLQVAYLAALKNVWINAIGLENFTLSSGLSAPSPSGSVTSNLNVPNLVESSDSLAH